MREALVHHQVFQAAAFALYSQGFHLVGTMTQATNPQVKSNLAEPNFWETPRRLRPKTASRLVGRDVRDSECHGGVSVN
jgi:hypothetical protein